MASHIGVAGSCRVGESVGVGYREVIGGLPGLPVIRHEFPDVSQAGSKEVQCSYVSLPTLTLGDCNRLRWFPWSGRHNCNWPYLGAYIEKKKSFFHLIILRHVKVNRSIKQYRALIYSHFPPAERLIPCPSYIFMQYLSLQNYELKLVFWPLCVAKETL